MGKYLKIKISDHNIKIIYAGQTIKQYFLIQMIADTF